MSDTRPRDAGHPADAEAVLAAGVRRTQPLRSLLRLLHPHRTRLGFAMAAFVIKDSPTWLLPPVTAAIIDIVVIGGPLWRIGVWAGAALLLLALNYPFAMVVVRITSAATRSLAYTVRAGLAARLQRFSLGVHNCHSAAVVQTKIIRDVENIELMLAQVFPTVLSAVGAGESDDEQNEADTRRRSGTERCLAQQRRGCVAPETGAHGSAPGSRGRRTPRTRATRRRGYPPATSPPATD